MAFVLEALKFLAELALGLLCRILFHNTGEALLWALSGGRRRPQWKTLEEDDSAWDMFFRSSVWLGAAFWVVVLGGFFWWLRS